MNEKIPAGDKNPAGIFDKRTARFFDQMIFS